MQIKNEVSVFWFRRDLRIEDNAGLYHALKDRYPVLPIFIFDSDILEKLEDKSDLRVNFIYNTIRNLNNQLKAFESSCDVRYGTPFNVFTKLFEEYEVRKVYTNEDYEPYARNRDRQIEEFLKSRNIGFLSFKDQCIFEKDEVLTGDSKPYTVFTPYAKKWMQKVNNFYLQSYPCSRYSSNFLKWNSTDVLKPENFGFKTVNASFPVLSINENLLEEYELHRNFPALDKTSRLGVHLRFGTLSIRHLVSKAMNFSPTFLTELIWREFYMQILWHFPFVQDKSFKDKFNRIQWRNVPEEFSAWCEGRTGYPIVDAGMRQLNETGFMHNRVRMITASFLTKHLLVDWRWGEAYFAKKLLDYDLAANNGGWQWAAGTGTDASPYFRVFNPILQTQKFDPELEYIKKWVPEFQELTYSRPIVEHAFARERCLTAFKKAIGEV